MFLTFTKWDPTIPFTIVALNGGSTDSLISTRAVKPYIASVTEISIQLQAMFWIRGFNTRCFRGQYRSTMLYTMNCLYCRHHKECKLMYLIIGMFLISKRDERRSCTRLVTCFYVCYIFH